MVVPGFSSGPYDQTTPKAQPTGVEKNPFDALQETTQRTRDASTATERATSFSNALLTPGYTASTRSSLAGVPTTSITRTAPDFTMKLPPPKPKAKTRPESHDGRTAGGAPVGCLRMRIVEAKNLDVATHSSKPYVVVQFDKNEFIGEEFDAEASGGQGNSSNPVWQHEVTFDVTSSNQVLYLSVYDRIGDREELLGARELFPRLVHRSSTNQWYTLYSQDDANSSDHTPHGEIHLQMSYERLAPKKLTARDFEFLKLIGRGTFGRVFQVRKRDSKRIYAMKVLSKREIAMKKEVSHTMGERKILEKSLDCPFLVGLKFSFQSETELFFVTDYKSGGELFWHLQREGRFTEARARFYIAELILALEHLHKYNIVYRDLKPENILLDATGHVALCDFGLSKADLGAGQLTNTFCGTTEYLAPEILLDETGYSKLVDFWSLGVLLFEMCCGWSPFYAEDTQQMYRNICFGKIKFPRGAIGDDGKQFVKGLLNRNPKHRLGARNDAQDLKEHPFFRDIEWEALLSKQIAPMFKPLVESDESVANFDPEFTSTHLDLVANFVDDDDDDHDEDETKVGSGGERVRSGESSRYNSPETNLKSVNIKKSNGNSPEEPLSRSVQEKFRGFSYTGSYDEMGSAWENRFGAANLHDDVHDSESDPAIAMDSLRVDAQSKDQPW
ncbi:non-specific serine/threonine protein kinase [Malassezia yamatoensis]|uniref:Non-specific serine/threonine protein kinase n=1 Tax=Malassezia yamatoensis TaxID=253288 RepID=A0AAJ6CIK0_9BASI|nr:non-specific serine/threonine protein kinase [Malassezia yamatoensis]